MNREQWLEARRTGIGSSAAAAVCGLSPWQSPLGLYMQYVEPAPDVPTEAMKWGVRLEPAVARAYAEETGRVLRKPEMLLRHRRYDWMIASLDYETEDGGVVEIKTARSGDGWGESGTDEVPEHYAIQVQHQMAVADRPRADIAVLIGGNDFRIYTVERNDDLIASLVKIEEAFWGRVISRTPPEVDWQHPETPALIERLYRPVDGESIVLPVEAEALADEYLALSAQCSAHEKAKSQIKAKLVALLGSASVGQLPGGRVVTRKMVQRAAYEVPANEYAAFRIAEPKTKGKRR